MVVGAADWERRGSSALGRIVRVGAARTDNPSQRHTVVEVICAYLRMPYTLPDPRLHPRLRRRRRFARSLTSVPRNDRCG